MTDIDFIKLNEQVDALNSQNKYLEIIELLDEKDIDYTLAIKLAKAYINAFNSHLNLADRDLLEGANLILDNFAIEGRNDPLWLFVKGYALFKQGLIDNAKLRFDHALQYVSLTNKEHTNLLANLNKMQSLCVSLSQNQELLATNEQELKIYADFIKQTFGDTQLIKSIGGVDILLVNQVKNKSYKLLITKGLLQKTFTTSDTNSECVELVFALPSAFDNTFNDDNLPYQIQVIYDLIAYILQSANYIGFGFCFDKHKPLAQNTKYCGAMLCGLGDFKVDQQSLVLGSKTLNLMQIIPLYEGELNYRQSHSAKDLLDLFKLRRISLTPSLEGRPCVI